jgi:hypothetical protein
MNNTQKGKLIKQELDKLMQKHNGYLKPVDIVKEARTNKILHDSFEWNNTVAGEKYRLQQARMLMQVYVVLEGNPNSEPVRAFVSLSGDEDRRQQGYRDMCTVMADPNLRQRLLADAYNEMKQFQLKYNTLKELRPVIRVITNTLKKKK